MRRIIDLSHPITSGMPVFPGDPPVEFEHVIDIDESGYNVTRLHAGTHAGTHLDVPHHCIRGGGTVDAISLDALVGPAEVLDLGDVPPGSETTAAHLEPFADRVGEGARVLLRTGWSRRWGSPEFFTGFPGLSLDAAQWLADRGVALLGLEQPSVHSKLHKEVHTVLLSAGIVLVETMANLHALSRDRVYLAALPLNLTGLDGSPVRAIAIEED